MNKIKVLPDNLANQIAAGEVVERPASVVKELVENSIDAGAKQVQIDIELGGRRLIKVVDNGEGMTRDDAILAFERHATSKIKELEDLGRIATLGFRGEALASIASVAKVELITKTEQDAVGTQVLIEGGKLVDVKDAARVTGTTISIRDLFFNTPARRKFMRSEATENYHLTNIATHYALAHPEIAFTLNNNGREVLRASAARDLRERAYQIFGPNLIESLLHVEGGREYVAKINGYVSAPRERRTTRDSQYFFINQRFVKDKLLARALSEGFRAVLPHGVFPVAFLFLDVPVEEVDVNVHPAKTEVRFRRAEAVKDVVAEAIRQTLASNGIAPQPTVLDSFDEKESDMAAVAAQGTSSLELTQQKIEFAAERKESFEDAVVQEKESFSVDAFSNDFETQAKLKSGEAVVTSVTVSQSDTQKIPEYRGSPRYVVMPPVDSALKLVKEVEPETLTASIVPVGQLHESYIIAVDGEGLLLVDQHVAHERILFDKFRKKENDRSVESQNLLLPETIDLTPAQAAAFDIVEEELESLGFSLMRLSGRTLAVKSVPADLPVKEIRNLLSEILETVDREKRGNSIENLRDDIAASLACKAAVKVNMKLTHEKMQWLIDNLLVTSSPTTCPHGRPVILRLTIKDIERGFHRT